MTVGTLRIGIFSSAQDALLHVGVGPNRFAFITQNQAGELLIVNANANAAKAVTANGTGLDINDLRRHPNFRRAKKGKL
jgi:hypothetical protein